MTINEDNIMRIKPKCVIRKTDNFLVYLPVKVGLINYYA